MCKIDITNLDITPSCRAYTLFEIPEVSSEGLDEKRSFDTTPLVKTEYGKCIHFLTEDQLSSAV